MRPIRLTDDAINAYVAALKKQLTSTRMYKKTTFSIDPAKSIKSTTRPIINFNALAYLKMLTNSSTLNGKTHSQMTHITA